MAGEQFRRLEAEGIANAGLPEEVQQALDGLSEAEVDALITAKQKVRAAANEVEGFAAYMKLGDIKGEVTTQTARPGGQVQGINPDEFAHEGGFIF